MPRGDPKRPTMLRLRPGLAEAVADYGVPLTQAIEEGLDLWLARADRERWRREGSNSPARSTRKVSAA